MSVVAELFTDPRFGIFCKPGRWFARSEAPRFNMQEPDLIEIPDARIADQRVKPDLVPFVEGQIAAD